MSHPSKNNSEKENKQNFFSEIFILQKLMGDYPINVLLDGEEKYLEPILEWLTGKSLITIEVGFYQVTPKGREVHRKFTARYLDFLIHFDVFCGIDLSTGKFAFEDYWKIEDESAWKTYVNSDNFEDLRIAVARYKALDPKELVYMSFINEGRFETVTANPGWQFDVASGKLWEEIDEIVDSAITVEQLAFSDKEGYISGEEVLSDIMVSGAELNKVLWAEQEAYFNEEYDFDLKSNTFDQGLKNYGDKNYVNPVWKDDLLK